jgi:hypothetical protein
MYIPLYQGVLGDFLSGKSTTPPNVTMNNVLKWVRAGSPAQRQVAWNALIGPIKAPQDPGVLQATAGLAAHVDTAARRLLSRLYLDAESTRGDFTADPPADPAWAPLLVAQLRGNLLNLDGARGFSTRRLCVDVLKKLQTLPAYQVLLEAHDQVNAEITNATGANRALAEDLLARINAAIQPYFVN